MMEGSVKRLDKSKFCDWICKNGTATDFAKFDSVVQILKEFVEAKITSAATLVPTKRCSL